MLRHFFLLVCLACLAACDYNKAPANGDVSGGDYKVYDGFVNLYWQEQDGRLLFRVDALDEPFLYQSSLPRGVGSNDLGLDRGQLGATRIVRFVRSGPKILLIADNLDYRAVSDDADERQAIDESFARSVIWGFEIAHEDGDAVLVDGTDFFLRDAHELSARLSAAEEGEFSIDPSRSAIYLPRTKGFPDNTEIEAIVTYTGKAIGEHLPTVVPDPAAITVHLHHSFVRLPDNNYEPMAYDPRAGVIGMSYERAGYLDYASAIGEPLRVNLGRRHRLEKPSFITLTVACRNPFARRSWTAPAGGTRPLSTPAIAMRFRSGCCPRMPTPWTCASTLSSGCIDRREDGRTVPPCSTPAPGRS
jgi:hypothetical protein